MTAFDRLRAIPDGHWVYVPKDELIALVEASIRAEQKLRIEYRRWSDPREEIPDSESWREGEALADALADLEEKLT